MTSLDARALLTDPEGLELLRAVLDTGRRGGACKPAAVEAEHLRAADVSPENRAAARQTPADKAGWIEDGLAVA